MSLPFTYTYQYELLDPWIEALAAEIEQPAVEHAFDENTLTLTRGQPGVRLDTEEAARLLRAAVDDLDAQEVELPVIQVEPREWSQDELRCNALARGRTLARSAPARLQRADHAHL